MDNSEVEQILALTSEIYDAALDPTLWPDVLMHVCGYVGGSAANLFSQDADSRRAAVFFQWGNDPAYERSYLEKYCRMNPLVPAMSFFEVGQVHSQSDVISYEEFYQTRFYNEWVRPQGIIDVVGANLEKADTRFAMLAVRRHERDGRVTEDTKRRMGVIVPHVRRSLAIGQVIDFNAGLAAALTETLEALKTGVLLVDEDARVVFVNRSGQSLLDSGAVIRLADGALGAVDPLANRQLVEALSASRNGDRAIGVKGVAIPLPGADGERWIAHVLPLTSGARRQAGVLHAAKAAVFIREAAVSTPTALETVAKLYRLTPSEIRVLHAMVEIGGVPATAGALGLSETTVKTHLQNLFEKTGVNRQAELVKLVASTSNALMQ